MLKSESFKVKDRIEVFEKTVLLNNTGKYTDGEITKEREEKEKERSCDIEDLGLVTIREIIEKADTRNINCVYVNVANEILKGSSSAVIDKRLYGIYKDKYGEVCYLATLSREVSECKDSATFSSDKLRNYIRQYLGEEVTENIENILTDLEANFGKEEIPCLAILRDIRAITLNYLQILRNSLDREENIGENINRSKEYLTKTLEEQVRRYKRGFINRNQLKYAIDKTIKSLIEELK